MDKNAIKKYAIWARNELIARIAQKALRYGISKDSIVDAYADSINGVLLSAVEKRQRQALIAQIEAKGFEQVVEEVAYTWFNRFCALRFMEVNGYLPSNIRVLSDEGNDFKPEILTKAIELDFESLDMETVYSLKEANKDEELYRYLLIVQCNELNKILPHMFQKLEDYTELLLPDNLLRDGSVVEQLVTTIPQEDFDTNKGGQVEIIGWLYQYYNTEPKAETFALLKKNVKITKERIPSATQLFTPDWIVRYMVENSLGRMWLEGHPNDELKANWKYYLEEAKQEADVEAELVKIRNQYAQLDPKDIKVIDPCMGSGHILVYAFEVLMQIYTSFGYTEKEAAISILENNLYGLDIDERAFQLAYFAVMMKARQYHKFIFKKEVQCNIHSIVESNGVNVEHLQYFGAQLDELNKNVALTQMQELLHQMHDAKEYGSIVNVENFNWDLLYQFIEEFNANQALDLFLTSGIEDTQSELQKLIAVGELLTRKYEVVVTNPPYMGIGGMGAKLANFVKIKYAITKNDMSTVMMEVALRKCSSNGFVSMINIPVWMFLSSYEKFRKHILSNNTICNMIHVGRGVFGSDFGTTVFTIRNKHLNSFIGCYRKLFDKIGEVKSIEERENALLSGIGKYYAKQDNYSKISGNPIAYWVKDRFFDIFKEVTIKDIAFPVEGIKTGENDLFLRLWYEVSNIKVSRLSPFGSKDWCFTTKGGAYRKWYGNIEYVIDWRENGDRLRRSSASSIYNNNFLYMPAITWTYLTAGSVSFRDLGSGMLYNNKGPAIFCDDKSKLKYLCGLLNTTVGSYILSILCSTLTFLPGDMKKIPVVLKDKVIVSEFVDRNILLSTIDWDSFETSWDFVKHPLIPLGRNALLETAYKKWKAECEERFNQLKANEEELNRIFIDIYGLQDELTPEIEDKDVTVRKADLQREIKSLLSYAVGCMFGRYSLDVEGLAYAGGEWDASKYSTFIPDADNVIPITDDEYFEDDIVGRFINWLKVVYGEETLEENLQFIANALGGKGTAREVIRKYFVNDFFNDHCKIYQKRPIYWLFDSGKKNGFKALIYMHRYAPDTIARIRTDYVHEQQARYRTILTTIEQRLDNASTAERVKINKELALYKDKEKELHDYEEKIHHLADKMISIDLDDGVKNNYAIFGDVLAKIK